MEDYTHIKDHTMARLRTSAHRLLVEKGRYARPPIPLNQRVCEACHGDQIEDKYHFMMICEKYKAEREALISSIIRICPNFSTLTEWDNFFIYIMTAGGEVQVHVAKFVKDNLP